MKETEIDFYIAFEEFKQWTAGWPRVEDDWAEEYPGVRVLVRAVCEFCADANRVKPYSHYADLIAEILSGTSESEMCIEAMLGCSIPDSVFETLVGAGNWKCRWQVYAYMDTSTPVREAILLKGIMDPCGYAARRAFLRLIDLEHRDLTVISQRLKGHSDPVINELSEKYG